jgi:hypothetical protein
MMRMKLVTPIKELRAPIKKLRAGMRQHPRGTSQDSQSRLGARLVRSPSHALPLGSSSQTSCTRPRNLKVVLGIGDTALWRNHMAH